MAILLTSKLNSCQMPFLPSGTSLGFGSTKKLYLCPHTPRWCHKMIKKNTNTNTNNPRSQNYLNSIRYKIFSQYNQQYLVSPSALAIFPNTWANELGIIPLSSGIALTPSIVNVFPVPVCPYANIVPEIMQILVL